MLGQIKRVQNDTSKSWEYKYQAPLSGVTQSHSPKEENSNNWEVQDHTLYCIYFTHV